MWARGSCRKHRLVGGRRRRLRYGSDHAPRVGCVGAHCRDYVAHLDQNCIRVAGADLLQFTLQEYKLLAGPWARGLHREGQESGRAEEPVVVGDEALRQFEVRQRPGLVNGEAPVVAALKPLAAAVVGEVAAHAVREPDPLRQRLVNGQDVGAEQAGRQEVQRSLPGALKRLHLGGLGTLVPRHFIADRRGIETQRPYPGVGRAAAEVCALADRDEQSLDL